MAANVGHCGRLTRQAEAVSASHATSGKDALGCAGHANSPPAPTRAPVISDEMIRDMMVHCVESRFGTLSAPYRVQWLSDNGSIFAAYKTIDIALALNLEPCFTPVESAKRATVWRRPL